MCGDGDGEKEEGGNTGNRRRRSLVARACRSAEKGQQLFLSYGRILSQSAAHSLCYYGFVVPSGSDPDAALEVDLLDALLLERGATREEGNGLGVETRHFLRATGGTQLPPAVLSAAEEVARLESSSSGEGGGNRPVLMSPGEVVRRAVAAARAALAATAERAERAIKECDSSSSFSSPSPFAHAILEYARSGVELADRVAAGALGW